MQYAVRIRAKMPEKATVRQTLKEPLNEAIKQTKDEETGEDVIQFACARTVKSVETVRDAEGDFEREIDNLTDILDEAEGMVQDADEYEVEYHICYHDEGGRACGKWKRGRGNGK